MRYYGGITLFKSQKNVRGIKDIARHFKVRATTVET